METGEETFGIFERGCAGKRLATGVNKKSFLEEVEIMVDICPTWSNDPWDLSSKPSPDGDEDEEVYRQKCAKEYREKHLYRAAEILGLQHRTHIFTISISGPYARLLYIDRGGVLVSERFAYTEDSTPLEEFLFRYLYAKTQYRGFDDSAKKASLKDTLHFEQAIRDFLDEEDNIHLPAFRKTLQPGARTFVLRVSRTNSDEEDDEGKDNEYIVQRPFFKKLNFGHNGTRGYLAWGRSEKKVVFLKDMWRLDMGERTETAMYERLEELGVPNLPTVRSGGDICWQAGDMQVTVSTRFQNAQFTWPRPLEPEDQRIHHRLVQDLVIPLRMVRNSRQLVQVIRDALEGTYIMRTFNILHLLTSVI